MSTSLTTSTIDLTTDAGFRAFGAAMSAALVAVGLVRVTGETGIVDWTTAVRANAFFDLYRFNDTLQGTKPVYVKLMGPATGWSGTRIILNVAVGVATDGAGNFVGISTDTSNTVGGNASVSASSSLANVGTPTRTNQVCFSDGQLVVAWGRDPSGTNAAAFFAVSRTVNDLGAATGDGVVLVRMKSSSGVKSASSAQVLDFNGNVSLTNRATADTCFIPNGMTSSLIGSTPQVFKHYISAPKVRPIISMLSYFDAELAVGDTFTVKPVGGSSGVSRTYYTLTGYFLAGSSNISSTTSIAMLWE